jgi:GNAT superfamily N-acetyltransferase
MPNTPYDITLTDQIDTAGEDAIRSVLARYNRGQAGYSDWTPLSIFVRDPKSGEVIGGIIGRTSFKLFFLETFALPDEVRGQGLGSELLAKAEAEATRRGCVAAVLVTIHFQAPAFYARNGWQEFGRIEIAPPGHTRVYMRKNLSKEG